MTASIQSPPSTNNPLLTTDEWEIEIGRAIRQLRILRHRTQEELANSANISLSALRNLELGKGSTVRSLILAVRALGKSEWLNELSPKAPKVSPMELLRQRENAPTPKRRYKRKATSP